MPRPKPNPPKMAEKTWIRVFAPAKVNLFLHVLGQRADGLHDIDSLVAFAGVGDDVTVSKSDQLSLTADGPFAHAVPGGADNLVLRAARALAEAGGVTEGAAIRLTKRLPVASGIGGGSADAAATMHALIRLWHISLEASRLFGIAMELGADVPVCLAGRPMFVGGAGEGLCAAPRLPACWLVLANPLREAPTAAVFAARQGAFSAASRFIGEPQSIHQLIALLADRSNDLAAAARIVAPEVGAVLDALAKLPNALLTRMSGSGATGFALFVDQASAESAAAMLSQAWPEWWVAAAPILESDGGGEWTSIMSGAI